MWEKQVASLIKSNEIFSIDIRYVAENGNWQTITIPASKNNLYKYMNTICEHLSLQPIGSYDTKGGELIRCFIDPFLAHRTLVILTTLSDTYKKEVKMFTQYSKKILEYNKQVTDTGYDVHFVYKTKVNEFANNLTSSCNNISPPEDIFRDVRTEVVLALSQMGVEVLKHSVNYTTKGKTYNNTITIQKPIYYFEGSNNSELPWLNGVDSIQKLKYAVLMVAKAYSIKVDLAKGVFTNYTNPYEQIYKTFL